MANLRDLGLSEYEASAYRALLETGPATAKELSEVSGVPMGRIYDVLGTIESQHLVRSQAASRPKKYVAVDPDTALDRLLEDRKRELEEKADQYEEVVDELSRDLEGPRTPDDGFWTAALGPEDSLELLLERIESANDAITLVSGSFSSSFDLADATSQIMDALEKAVGRNVDVSVLLSVEFSENIPPNVEAIYNDIADDPNFEVRVGGSVGGNVLVLDNTEVLLDVSNPVDPDRSLAIIDLQDETFAADVKEEFLDTWENAVTLD